MVGRMDERPLDPSRLYLLKHTTRTVTAEANRPLALNQIETVTLTASRPLVFDRYEVSCKKGAASSWQWMVTVPTSMLPRGS